MVILVRDKIYFLWKIAIEKLLFVFDRRLGFFFVLIFLQNMKTYTTRVRTKHGTAFRNSCIQMHCQSGLFLLKIESFHICMRTLNVCPVFVNISRCCCAPIYRYLYIGVPDSETLRHRLSRHDCQYFISVINVRLIIHVVRAYCYLLLRSRNRKHRI